MRTASSCPTTRRASASSILQQLVLLALEHLRDGNAGPLRDDLGDLLLGDLVAQELRLLLLDARAACASRFSSSGMRPYCSSDMRARSCRAARGLELELGALELLLDVRRALQRGLLGLPDLLEIRVFLLERPRAVSSSASSRFFEASSSSFFSASRSIFSWMMRRSSRSIASGLESISMRMRDAASSIRSIALSGSCRSVM